MYVILNHFQDATFHSVNGAISRWRHSGTCYVSRRTRQSLSFQYQMRNAFIYWIQMNLSRDSLAITKCYLIVKDVVQSHHIRMALAAAQ